LDSSDPKSEIRNWKFEMSEIALRVENLSKLYRIGQREVYRTLRDTLTTDNETAKEGNRDHANWN
jgi:hypothetical protein